MITRLCFWVGFGPRLLVDCGDLSKDTQYTVDPYRVYQYWRSPARPPSTLKPRAPGPWEYGGPLVNSQHAYISLHQITSSEHDKMTNHSIVPYIAILEEVI